ncbi:hypothetical protein S7711_05352 [Stachybotrys chartarum IBT 7711]|uniref:Glutamine amidotransferase type-2 domain-containing protein n=1 Tax=Stachybotrys chartarum (strain CBS 109288 / IBT 7711) TaxID=1280523 RepID=A0A084B972_STACB|nr:hypothetical protein S7711_05352 [Stachybotrys chartarum IBT 7711]
MCGIHAQITAAKDDKISPELDRYLQNRGPDHRGTFQARIDLPQGPLYLTLTSTVLSLRGDHVVKQPLVDPATGSVLCWNGEAWRINGEAVEGNDAEAVLSLLAASSHNDRRDEVLDALRAVEGPFAFIYFDKPAGRLYYGRDRLGRRSLLIQSGESVSLCSVTDSAVPRWDEVEADGCYELFLDESFRSPERSILRHEWDEDTTNVSSIGVFNMEYIRSSPPPPPMDKNSPSVQQLRVHLLNSLQPRVLGVPTPPGAGLSDARIAVLFSGGLDCTVLARLCSEIVPYEQSIDLINVAFENPRIALQNRGKPDVNLYELCPDRITGRKSFAELKTTCPRRNWRFVMVNVPYETTLGHRAEIIRLMYPHNTEMDLSIACALYFAARGQGLGQASWSSEPATYSTTARVLLSGLGADELFGGYGRHGVAYSRQGYQGLAEELKLDVARLGKRNLGRDDRVMAHWGREVRFPFLDERLVKWAIESPAWDKCDFDHSGAAEDDIEPGKRVLRLLAEELGMTSVSREKKRAIQFGARTAKMESGRVKGTTLIQA